MNTRIAEFAMAKHTVAAKGEMDELEKLLLKIIGGAEENMPQFYSLN